VSYDARVADELRADHEEKGKKLRGRFFRPAAFLIIAVAATAFCGCNRAGTQTGNNNNAPASSPSPRKPLTEFERDLEYVRTGQFTYIYLISRADGSPLNNDDIAYLKQNAPPQTNQWVLTDEKRRVIAGTNFEFTPENLDALRKRFVVEDYSGK